MDLRYFVMDAATLTFGSSAIVPERAWNSIYCFELRFYHLQDNYRAEFS